jgi:aminocarboxymuconate-semialdehyde decarboxylase
MMIDLHTHVVPPSTPFLRRLTSADPRWARLEPNGQRGSVIVAGQLFRKVLRVSWDLYERRDHVMADGVTGQLLSAMPELFAPWAPVVDALDYARAFNEWMAGEIADHDGFYAGLGVVPVQDPDAAAGLLADIEALGLLGVEIPSAPPGAPLYGPGWEGFLAEAERRELLVFVHAVGGPSAAGFPHPSAANGILFPNAVGEAVGGLIGTGVLARHPRLRLLISHGGGSLLSSLPRLNFLWSATPELRGLMPEPPAHYARQLWYDPLLFDAGLLNALVHIVGSERVVLGSDYPFMPTDPLAFLNSPEVPAELSTAIRSTNPRRLLELVSRGPAKGSNVS